MCLSVLCVPDKTICWLHLVVTYRLLESVLKIHHYEIKQMICTFSTQCCVGVGVCLCCVTVAKYKLHVCL